MDEPSTVGDSVASGSAADTLVGEDAHVAAFPSLHAAYPALIAAFFWTRLGRPGRMALVAYPLAMAMTLVISGDHYVIDIIGGWALVGVVVAGWGRMSARPAVSRWLTT